MEQQTNLSDVQVVLSVTASPAVSLSSVECTRENENAYDDYDDGPDEGPETEVVSVCLQEQA